MAGRRSRSKKRSGASFDSTPPDEQVVFFLDECLGRHDVATALRAAGARVEVHADHFPQGTLDAEWLAGLNARGWVVLTKDRGMKRRPLELDALKAAGLQVFALTAADLRGEEMGRIFVAALPRMRRLCAKRGAFLARITRAANVEAIG